MRGFIPPPSASSKRWASFSSTWVNNLGLPPTTLINNTYSISGHQLSQIPADLPASGFYDLYQVGKTNVAILARGTNDLGNAGYTDAQTYAYLQTAVGMAKAAGFYTIVQTIAARNDTGWNATKEAYRISYNALVRTNTAGADAIADLAADPILGAATTPNNPLLSVDKLHPTNAGQDRYAAVMRSAILSLAMAPVRLPNSLRAITLNTSTGTLNGFASSLAGTLRSGALLTATSGDGTPVTTSYSGGLVNIAATFSTAGTKNLTLVETTIDGLSSRTSNVVATILAPVAMPYVRLTTLTNLTESVDGSGYDYTSTSSAAGYGAAAVFGRPSTSLAASTDGYFGGAIAATGASGPIYGLSTNSSASAYTQMALGIYQASGPNYQVIVNNVGVTPANAVIAAGGDLLRVRRAGSMGYAEVSKDGGNSWVLVHSATISTAQLFGVVQTASNGAYSKIVQPYASGFN